MSARQTICGYALFVDHDLHTGLFPSFREMLAVPDDRMALHAAKRWAKGWSHVAVVYMYVDGTEKEIWRSWE